MRQLHITARIFKTTPNLLNLVNLHCWEQHLNQLYRYPSELSLYHEFMTKSFDLRSIFPNPIRTTTNNSIYSRYPLSTTSFYACTVQSMYSIIVALGAHGETSQFRKSKTPNCTYYLQHDIHKQSTCRREARAALFSSQQWTKSACAAYE
jgi:hypothetical protein